ncbi:MAG: ATP-binding protein [Nanoarchaeota archaeon]|nr:ATP-binding protein [Nanoarchaeota archaeon]
MLEFKLDDSSYVALNQGKQLMASSENKDHLSTIENIYSGIYREITTYFMISHFMTRFGRVDDQSRQKFLTSFSLDSQDFPCSSGRFSRKGINYFLNTHETAVCKGDDYIHASDVLCSILEASFAANSKEDFVAKVQDYISLANAIYNRFYEQGKSPQVILKFEELDARRDIHEFECVKNNHSPEHTQKQEASTTEEDEKRPIYYGRKMRQIKWDDIGGLFIPKQQIKEYLDDFLDPETALALGLDPAERGGVMLFGETGTGKTLVAEAVSTELAAKYGKDFLCISIDYSFFANIYRGGETQKTRQLFGEVNYYLSKGKTLMLFIDEGQSIAQRTNCPSRRIVNEVLDQLLVETSRFDYGKCLLMTATAQDPSTIDQQLMRPGRFGTHIFFNNPIYEEAVQILQKGIEKRVSESEYNRNKLITRKGIRYDVLAEQTQGFTLADLYFLVVDVFRDKVRQLRQEGKFDPIKTSDFEPIIKQRRIAKSKTMSKQAVI